MTIKIGVCGAPSAGKSTVSASVFTSCKKVGIKTELIQEFARIQLNKGWKINSISEQFIINKNQREMEDIVPDAIDVLITDSPAFLTFFYALWNVKSTDDNFILSEMYKQFLEDLNRYDKIIFLNRVKPYVKDGTRIQTEEESDEISRQLKTLLDIHKVNYIELNGDEDAVQYIMNYIDIELHPGKQISIERIKSFINTTTNTTVPSDKYTSTIGGYFNPDDVRDYKNGDINC